MLGQTVAENDNRLYPQNHPPLQYPQYPYPPYGQHNHPVDATDNQLGMESDNHLGQSHPSQPICAQHNQSDSFGHTGDSSATDTTQAQTDEAGKTGNLQPATPRTRVSSKGKLRNLFCCQITKEEILLLRPSEVATIEKRFNGPKQVRVKDDDKREYLITDPERDLINAMRKGTDRRRIPAIRR